MSLWLEVWTRPGDANFRRLIDDVPFRDCSIHDSMDDLGDGGFTVPDTFFGFDDILLIDGLNSQTSLVRVRDDTGAVVFEWLPSQIVPISEANDPYVEVSGRGIKEILEWAVTMPYDNDGTLFQAPSIPNWQWGANNMLSLPGFEDPPVTNKVIELQINATGGTYTLNDETDTTAAIAWDATAATIKTRIETDLGLFNEVIVVLAGPGRHVIQMVDPPFGVNLGIDPALLTGGTEPRGTTTTTVEGGYNAGSWTPARSLVSGAPTEGAYDFWGISDNEAHAGTFSLQFNGGFVGTTSNRNGGAQHVVNVEPGGLYQASVWVFPTNATPDPRIRVAVFSEWEELLVYNAPNGVPLTENVWTEVDLGDIIIPDGVERIIYRIQLTNEAPYNPPPVYIDDAAFYPGLPADTIGGILTALYDHYVDASLRSPIMWGDGSGAGPPGSGGAPYLTLDFDGTVDSSGAAWADGEISFEVFMRRTFWDVLTELQDQYGIEFRVVPNSVEDGTWFLQVYDKGNMDAAPDVTIMGGSDDTRRQIRRFRPQTVYVVEGAERGVAFAEANTLMTDLGRIEMARLVKEAAGEDGISHAAQQDAEDAPITGLVWSYRLTNPVTDQPLTDYVLGDTIMVHDPPEADGLARLWEVTVALSPERVEWDLDLIVDFEDEGSF